jgi:hypothetical protein
MDFEDSPREKEREETKKDSEELRPRVVCKAKLISERQWELFRCRKEKYESIKKYEKLPKEEGNPKPVK